MSMGGQEPTDHTLPVFWSLSPSPSHPGSASRSISEPDYDEHRCLHPDPQILALTLFDRPRMDSSDYLGLGIGLGFHSQQEQDSSNGDWGCDEFFIGRRRFRSSYGSDSESESNSEFSRARPVDYGGLRFLDFESDPDPDEQIVAIGDDSISNDQVCVQDEMDSPNRNLNLPLCWDCLRIDEDRRDLNEEFEWEEIDGRLEEREVISMNQQLDRGEGDEMGSNVEWEVLFTDLGNADYTESYFDEGFVYTTSESDEVTFAQFHEHHDSLLKGSPPASKIAVENLPSIVLTKNDVENNHASISCAVCKEEFAIQEKAKRLPCSHCYHDECILPWLGMRNTCPLCRYELPTDDPEYESWKARREGSDVGGPEVVVEEDERVRYDFEILPDA